MRRVTYNTSEFTYSSSRITYYGRFYLVDNKLVYPIEFTLLNYSDSGPSDWLLTISCASVGVYFCADDPASSIKIQVSNDGINYVDRLSITGKDIKSIHGGYKYIRVVRVSGLGSVTAILRKE